MPKSSSFGLPVGRDEDVRRLEVAVHDQVRGARAPPRRRPARNSRRRSSHVEPLRVAVLVDRLAVDVLHDADRAGRPRVTPPSSRRGDVGVLEAGEDLALARGSGGRASASASRRCTSLSATRCCEPSVGALGRGRPCPCRRGPSTPTRRHGPAGRRGADRRRRSASASRTRRSRSSAQCGPSAASMPSTSARSSPSLPTAIQVGGPLAGR